MNGRGKSGRALSGRNIALAIVHLILASALASFTTSLAHYAIMLPWPIRGIHPYTYYLAGCFGVMTILSVGVVRGLRRRGHALFVGFALIELSLVWIASWLFWGRVGLLPLRLRPGNWQFPPLGLAIYLTFAIGFLVFAFLSVRLWRRQHRPSPEVCRDCGYDLRGSSNTRCPECGRSLTSDEMRGTEGELIA